MSSIYGYLYVNENLISKIDWGKIVCTKFTSYSEIEKIWTSKAHKRLKLLSKKLYCML